MYGAKYNSSKGKHLVSLALNKSLKRNIQSIKKRNAKKRIIEIDPDYVPDESNNSSEDDITPEMKRQKRQEENLSLDENSEPFIKEILLSLINIAVTYTVKRENDFGTPVSATGTGEKQRIIVLEDILIKAGSKECPTDKNVSETLNNVRNFIRSILFSIVDAAIIKVNAKIYTKKGAIRKRKFYDTTVSERKRQKAERTVSKHNVKPLCTASCPYKCSSLISTQRIHNINNQFWNMDIKDQDNFVVSCVKKMKKARLTVKDGSRRTNTFKYYLLNEQGNEINVCKTFLLAVLGFNANNDSLLKRVRQIEPDKLVPKPRKRGCHPCKWKIDRDIIKQHIHTFSPSISHYRREHAPNRLYLPSDITIAFMHKDFQKKIQNLNLALKFIEKRYGT